MGFRTKKQLQDAIIRLDEHERAMSHMDKNPSFWLWLFSIFGTVTLIWIVVLIWVG